LALFLAAASLAACSHGGATIPAIASSAWGAQPQSPATSGYASIYSFGQNAKANDGARPVSTLVDVHGQLYGTTEYGGTTNAACYLGCGTVFRLSISGQESVIYRFTGGDGAAPAAGLIVVSGALVGTTSAGGTAKACTGGCGTVFELSTDGRKERVLYNFSGGADGANPVAAVVSLGGTLYGTTQFGGKVTRLCNGGCGTVFELPAGGGERAIHAFKGGADGAYPIGGLLARNGRLYGTTQYGGTITGFCETGCGTVFSMSTAGVKKTLHDFDYKPSLGDGGFPAATLIAMGGTLYGTTFGGGQYAEGAVFSVDIASGMEKVLHDFRCCSKTARDGRYPVAALTAVKGVLYGATRSGGTTNQGTVFVLTTSGAESVLHDFTGKPDGAVPQAALRFVDGHLYGTTTGGGSASEGTVFSVTSP
jgi:uncharacterized repeat protein (TIGR03803 family)